MRQYAESGERRVLVEDDWDGDQLAYGVLVDLSTGQAWEVPVGTALAGGYWDAAIEAEFDIAGWTVKPWPARKWEEPEE